MPTVLITGANRGLGFEFARQYASDGWRVIGTVRDAAGGARLEALGTAVEAHPADVAERPSLARLARDLKGEPIDLLICNAGVLGPLDAWLGNTDYAVWEQMHRVNVMGPMATVEALAGNVAASARKQIVLMSSQAGSLARGLNPLKASHTNYLYRASKAALSSLMLSLTQMLADRGVTVISIAPGWVRTDMGGPDALYGPEESVASMRKVMDGLTLADSGRFYRLTGEQAPW